MTVVLTASDFKNDIDAELKISEELFKEIINYQVGGSGKGKGELSAILFKDGKNHKKDKKRGIDSGDISILENIIENYT